MSSRCRMLLTLRKRVELWHAQEHNKPWWYNGKWNKQAQNNEYYMLEQPNFWKQKLQVIKCWGLGEMESYCLPGAELWFLMTKKVSSGTFWWQWLQVLWMYLLTANCILKTVKMLNLILNLLYQRGKKREEVREVHC